MKIATVIARILLGLIFVVFGSNAFLHFLPTPPLPQGVTGEYLHAFFARGFVYSRGGLQVIGGLLLLIGRFVPLGLTILGAIIVDIWLFHVLMAPEGLGPAILVGALEIFLVWRYRDAFKGILSPRSKPCLRIPTNRQFMLWCAAAPAISSKKSLQV